MKKLNYSRVMALNPTVIVPPFANMEDQQIELLEHPTQGDLAHVLVHFIDLKMVFETEFYDTCDLIEGAYQPVYAHGHCLSAWENGHVYMLSLKEFENLGPIS